MLLNAKELIKNYLRFTISNLILRNIALLSIKHRLTNKIDIYKKADKYYFHFLFIK